MSGQYCYLCFAYASQVTSCPGSSVIRTSNFSVCSLDYFGTRFEDLKGNLALHLVIQKKNEGNTPRYPDPFPFRMVNQHLRREGRQMPIRLCVPKALLLDPGDQRLLTFGRESGSMPWCSSNVLLLIGDDEISTHLSRGEAIASFEEWEPGSVS